MKKYNVKKVSDQGKDVQVDTAKFDALLKKMPESDPVTADVVASRKRSPKKQ